MEKIITNPDEINSCDALLVSGHSWLARIIQKFERLAWNHAGLFMRLHVKTVINDVTYMPGLYVAEMVAKGLVLTDFDEYIMGKSHLLICRPTFPVDEQKYWEHIKPQLGKEKYGIINLIFCQPIKFLTNKRVWLGSLDENPPRLICGEFVEREYHFFNSDIFTNWQRDAPSDIFADNHFEQYSFVR